ncbi:MAG: hypothetical protein JWM21_865 [Acidobacteria bacterium]|nr:hypothetical protein [Acidobacteriota bacterium]
MSSDVLIRLEDTSMTTPIAMNRNATLRDAVLQASAQGVTLYNGQPVDVLLDDPHNRSSLDVQICDVDFLQTGVVRLFEKPTFVVLVVNKNGRPRYYDLPSSMTVGDLKVTMLFDHYDKSCRRGAQLSESEFLITGTRTIVGNETPLLSLTTVPYCNVCLDLVQRISINSNAVPVSTSIPERICRAHLKRGNFQSGVDHGYWRLVSIDWPHAVIALRRGEPGQSSETFIRFTISNYPTEAPTIELWNTTKHRSIGVDEWPLWFSKCVADTFPDLMTLEPEPYTPELLRISESIARRRKQRIHRWKPGGDLTQCLIRFLVSYRDVSPPVSLASKPFVRRKALQRDPLRRAAANMSLNSARPCSLSHGLFDLRRTH